MRQRWSTLMSLALVGGVLATQVWGGFEDGLAAYKAGQYGHALKEWEPLAEQGHVKAQYNLGIMYERGLGVPKDPRQAFQWYEKAAGQGLAFAQNNLGAMYEAGVAVEEDYVRADMWYLLSGKQGNEVAVKNHKKLIAHMTREQIAQARKQADEWKPVPAKKPPSR